MAQANTTSLLDRVENTLKDLEKDWSDLQHKADKRRKDFERRADREIKRLQAEFRKNPLVKRAEKQRKDLEKRAERLRARLLGSAPVKRAEQLRKDTEKAIETQVDSALDRMRIASASDVSKLERKVNSLNRKIAALEKKPAGRTKAA